MAPVAGDTSSLSIQERHRAMAAVDTDPVEASAEEALKPTTNNDSSKGPESSGPKRSSVIDMWKKRESTIIAASAANRRSVVVFPKPGDEEGDHVEEKKEASLEEDDPAVSKSKPTAGPSPKRSSVADRWREQSTAAEPPKSTTPSGAPTRSKVRGMWKQRESVVKSAVTSKAMAEKEESPIEGATEEIEETSSSAPSKSRPPASPAAKRFPPSPRVSQSSLRVSQSESPSAFNELKSKWAKFGVDKEKQQESNGQQQAPGRESPSFTGKRPPSPVVNTGTSPASGMAKPSPSSSLMEKGRLAMQRRRQSPVIMGEEDSSIDGGATPRTVATPTKAPAESPKSAIASLQQPVLEVDSDGFPKMPQKTTPKREQLKKMGQLHAGRPKVVVDVDMANTPNSTSGGTPTSKGAGSSSASPFSRKFTHRKLLLEKHRRRGKASPEKESESPDPVAKTGTTSTTEHSRGSITSDLSQAFRVAGTDEDFEALSHKIAGTGSRPRAQGGPKINIDTLMSYAGNERAKEDGKLVSTPSEYSSLQVSNSFNKQDTPKSYRQSNDFFSDPDIVVDDRDMGTSQTSTTSRGKTSIATRAHQTLRGKRQMKNREAAEQAKQFPRDEHDSTRTKTTAQHTTDNSGRTASTSVTNASSVSASDAGATYDSETISTVSQTVASEATSVNKQNYKKKSGGLTPTAETVVTDKFVEESNTNVEAFATSLQAISLGQLANDVSDVMSAVDFSNVNEGLAVATHHLNEGMAVASQSLNAASESLSKLVGSDVFASLTPKSKRAVRGPSPVEEIAIEVEYVEDSDGET